MFRVSVSVLETDSETWYALSRVAILCNRAEFKAGQDEVPVMKR